MKPLCVPFLLKLVILTTIVYVYWAWYNQNLATMKIKCTKIVDDYISHPRLYPDLVGEFAECLRWFRAVHRVNYNPKFKNQR